MSRFYGPDILTDPEVELRAAVESILACQVEIAYGTDHHEEIDKSRVFITTPRVAVQPAELHALETFLAVDSYGIVAAGPHPVFYLSAKFFGMPKNVDVNQLCAGIRRGEC